MHVLLFSIIVLLLAISLGNPRSALALYALVSGLARLGFVLLPTLIGALFLLALISALFSR
jgi:hypothetical protein